MRRCLLFFLLLLAVPFGAYAQADHEGHRSIEFPDVPGYQTIAADLHIHTVFSDGSVWPDIRVEEAVRDGLEAIAITDHLEYQPHAEDIPHPDRNRAYEVARESKADRDLIVINGSEITREMPPGHANAVFVSDVNRLLKNDPMAVFKEARRQGAFAFWNHPMWLKQSDTGIATLTDMHRQLIRENLLQGIEVVNLHRYSAEAVQIALDHDLAMIGTSDVHGLIDWDYKVHQRGHHRPVTLVFAEEQSKSALKDALFERRTAVWYDNTLIGREKHLLPLIQASLAVEEATYRGDSSVLEVLIKNTSDAEYTLDSQSDYTFHATADLVTVRPQGTTRLQVKTGEREEAIELTFDVLNAVVAPEQHPTVTLDVPVTTEEPDAQ